MLYLYLFLFALTGRYKSRVGCTTQQVEVLDNHGVAEVVIGSVGAAHEGLRATFNDWEQFEKIAASINDFNKSLQWINCSLLAHFRKQ